MRCDFAHDDAAYVLGALSPAERLEFERHLESCDECAHSVRALAGMPGLLDLADARVLEDPPVDTPLPTTLLPPSTAPWRPATAGARSRSPGSPRPRRQWSPSPCRRSSATTRRRRQDR